MNAIIVSADVILVVVASFIARLRQVEHRPIAVSFTSRPVLPVIPFFLGIATTSTAPLPIPFIETVLSTPAAFTVAIGVFINAYVTTSPIVGQLTAIPGKCVVKDVEKEKT